MLVERAKVISYYKGQATIQAEIKTSCGGCQSKCGYENFDNLSGQNKTIIHKIKVNEELEENQIIKIGIQEHRFFYAVFMLYMIPLITLLLSTLMFSLLFNSELLILLGISLSLASSFIVIKIYLKKTNNIKIYYLGKIS